MAEQEDEVGRLYGVMECEVEAIFDFSWNVLLSQLEPSLQVELKEVTRSDGFQTYMPRVVWHLVGHLLNSRRQTLN